MSLHRGITARLVRVLEDASTVEIDGQRGFLRARVGARMVPVRVVRDETSMIRKMTVRDHDRWIAEFATSRMTSGPGKTQRTIRSLVHAREAARRVACAQHVRGVRRQPCSRSAPCARTTHRRVGVSRPSARACADPDGDGSSDPPQRRASFSDRRRAVSRVGRELAAALREDSELRAELVAALDLTGREAPPSRHLTVAAFAASRSIGKSTVRRAIREHRLEVVRVGRAVRVPADAVIAASARTTAYAAMRKIDAERVTLASGGAPAPMTVRRYAGVWIGERQQLDLDIARPRHTQWIHVVKTELTEGIDGYPSYPPKQG